MRCWDRSGRSGVLRGRTCRCRRRSPRLWRSGRRRGWSRSADGRHQGADSSGLSAQSGRFLSTGARARAHRSGRRPGARRCGARPRRRSRSSRPPGTTRCCQPRVRGRAGGSRLESPGRHRVNRPGSHALSPGGGDGPVGDVGGAVGELQVLQAGRPSSVPLSASTTAQIAWSLPPSRPASPQSTPASRPGSPPASRASAGSPHPGRRPSPPGRRQDSTVAVARRRLPSTWAGAAPRGNRSERWC